MSALDNKDLLAALHKYVRVCGGDPAKSTPYDERELESVIDEHVEYDLEAQVEQATAPLEDEIESLRAEARDAKEDKDRLQDIVDAARAALAA